MAKKIRQRAAKALSSTFKTVAAIGTGLTDGDTSLGYQGAENAILRATVAKDKIKNKLTGKKNPTV